MTPDVRRVLALVIAFFDACMIFMAAGFYSDVAGGKSPISPDLYGPEVYDIPALVWIGWQDKAALAGLVGALLIASDGRLLRIGAGVCAIGNTGLAVLFLTFAYFASGAPQGALLYNLAAWAGVPLAAACAVIAARITIWKDSA